MAMVVMGCLVYHFKYMFLVFKQYYMYFLYIFSPTRISKKTVTKFTTKVNLAIQEFFFFFGYNLRKS